MHPVIEKNPRARLADAWLRYQIEEGDQRSRDDLTAVWAGKQAELREAMGLTFQEAEDAEEVFRLLESSGEWDRLPAAGVNREQWFHAMTIEDEPVHVTDADYEAGVLALEAVEAPRNRNWTMLVDKPSRLDVLDMATRYKLPHIVRAVEGSSERVSFSAVQLVNAALAAHYLPNSRLTLMNYAHIAEATGLTVKVVGSAVRVLSEGGIWGVLRGRNGYRTRHYPLFVEQSLDLFAAYLP